MRLTLNILSLAVALFVAHALLRGTLPGPFADLPLAVRGVLALMALALGIRGYATGHTASRHNEASARRKRTWIDHTAATTALLVLHFAFLWLLGATPQVIERIGITAESWLKPEAAAKRIEIEADAHASESDRSGNWLWQDRRSRSLPERTNLRIGNRPEAILRFATREDAAAVVGKSSYLSSFALSKFEQDRWTTPTSSATRIEAGEDGVAHFPTPPARATFGLIEHQVFHGINSAGQNVLTALQGVESAEIAPLEQYDDGFITLPVPDGENIRFDYRVASRPLALADLPGDTLVIAESETPGELLELPEDNRITEHLLDQARAIAGENPTIRSIIVLETWLRDAFDYSLETTNPENLDPLENFLFSERRGHCEHFAMTAALMMRTLGIPTRIAYGWAGGTWYESSQLLVFRSREAHAWTEIWVPDYGWCVMDPTPPSSINGTHARVASPDETPPDPIEEWAESKERIDTTRIDLAAGWLLGIFGLPALLLLALRNRARSRSIAPGQSSAVAGIPATGYLRTWLSACPPLHAGETLRQQIHRQDPAPPFARELINYHYHLQYTSASRDPKTERLLEHTIRKWSKERETP